VVERTPDKGEVDSSSLSRPTKSCEEKSEDKIQELESPEGCLLVFPEKIDL
jgi:hypothetical protein